MAPSVTPTVSEIATDSTPTASVTCVPTRMRLNMSRPCWSQPKMCSALGVAKDCERSWAYGSHGTMPGKTFVTIAITTSSRMNTRLTIAAMLWDREYQTSFQRDSFSSGAVLAGASTVVSAMAITPLPACT